ncbi:MAG: YihY/virulence factor BrkB family protein [Gemmatimonadota bacterium]
MVGLLWAAYDVLRWPLAFVLIVALLCLIYYFLPDRDQRPSRVYVLIGALVGGALWVLTTLGFRLYVANFGSYDRTYGLVGAVIVLLIWMYLTALTVLVGGEVASSLEQKAHERTRSTHPNRKEAHG